MSDFVGYGTGFFNPDENDEWESSPGVSAQIDEVIENVSEGLRQIGYSTREEFELTDPLYLTEVRVVRQITWDDIKGSK